MVARHARRSVCALILLACCLAPRAEARPLVAVVAHNDGTEITDHLIPFAVLSAAGSEVHAVAVRPGPVRLIPADVTIEVPETIAAFDARHPGGAAIVVVPAVHADDDPALLAWVHAQADRGALVVGVCDGVWVLARAGVLDGRSATGHWYSLDALEREFPRTHWVRDRRYLTDGRVMTTTGVTAAIPASLALVDRVAGGERARAAAAALGVADWSPAHDSRTFGLTPRVVVAAAANGAAFWRHERVGLPVADGVDEIALALAADALSRTWRSQAFPRTEVAVTTRFGLRILPPPPGDAPADRMSSVLEPATPAARVLDRSLAEIRDRFGTPTADFVALQIEYPRPAVE